MLKIAFAKNQVYLHYYSTGKPNVKASKMNNFALDQIIGFLYYVASKE